MELFVDIWKSFIFKVTVHRTEWIKDFKMSATSLGESFQLKTMRGGGGAVRSMSDIYIFLDVHVHALNTGKSYLENSIIKLHILYTEGGNKIPES